MISAKFSGKVFHASISVLIISSQKSTNRPTTSLLKEIKASFVCTKRSLFHVSTELVVKIPKTDNAFDKILARSEIYGFTASYHTLRQSIPL